MDSVRSLASWSESEDALMRKSYYAMGSRVRLLLPGRNRNDIWKRAITLRLKSSGRLAKRTINENTFTRDELMYLCGIFYGEGHARCDVWQADKTPKKGLSVCITIANCDERLIGWLKEKVPVAYIGKSAPNKTTGRVCKHWNVSRARDCYTLAKLMIPHCIVKKEQLAKIIDFCDEYFILSDDEVYDGNRRHASPTTA